MWSHIYNFSTFRDLHWQWRLRSLCCRCTRSHFTSGMIIHSPLLKECFTQNFLFRWASISGECTAHLCQWASRFSSRVCLSFTRRSVPSYRCWRAVASWMQESLLTTFRELAERAVTVLLRDSRAWQRSWGEAEGNREVPFILWDKLQNSADAWGHR